MFNLFGGGTGFEDWLSGDNSYVWKKFAFKDKLPLLESEALAIDGSSGALGTPVFATDDAYGISYSREFDKDVDVVPGVTTVWNHNLAPGVAGGWTYTGALPGEIILTQTDYNDTAIWTVNATVTDTTATYHSDFENRTIFAEEWQTGGGWLRTKTYHTQITEETGQKDYYTHALRADYAIGVAFLGGSGSTINVSSKKDLLIQGNVSVANGGSVTLNSTDESVLGAKHHGHLQRCADRHCSTWTCV
ncbi:hypothetical protein LP419_39705 [Massilia sp. H-1]|nr:hypothetical protein LP419_39705 [Massilia sp. H-1]